MGIDIFGFYLLRLAARNKKLGRVATIGRQEIHIPRWRLQQLLSLPKENNINGYCEGMLTNYFGAEYVDSYDNSSYENATHVFDMNKPIETGSIYDTVYDGGCVEHIYNAPQALANISNMCAVGGQILHILPANNFCGHGFWQFSPELFFSLYTEENGYRNTCVFVADLRRDKVWYRVIKPEKGFRVNIASKHPLYLIVITEKNGAVSHENIQQSDYSYAWSDFGKELKVEDKLKNIYKKIIGALFRNTRTGDMILSYSRGLRDAINFRNLSLDRNPNLRKVQVDQLLASN